MSLEFTLIKLLQRIAPSVRKQTRIKRLDKLQQKHAIPVDLPSMTLAFCIAHHPHIMHDIQTCFNVALLVVQSFWLRKTVKTRLLYDGRHAIVGDDAPLHCIVLGQKNQFKKHTQSVEHLPRLTKLEKANYRCKSAKPLAHILELDSHPSPPNDPQTLQELTDFLHNYASPKIKIYVYYGRSQSVKGEHPLWYETPHSDVNDTLSLWAFAKPDYRIAYSRRKQPHFSNASTDIAEEYNQYLHLCDLVEQQENEACNPYQQNRAASIHLARSGLNLAYDLGLIHTEKQLHRLSNALAQTHSSLYVFLDDRSHLRCITYSDKEKTFTTQVPCCEHECQGYDDVLEPWLQKEEQIRRQKAASVMLAFWQKVWKRRQEWIQQRKKILAPLMEMLEQRTLRINGKVFSSPYSKCLSDLKKTIQHQHAYMYCSQDTHLHAIKFYLTDFAYHTFKKSRGLSIKASSDSTLTMLCIPGFTVINLHNYFDCDSDEHFFYSLINENEPKPGDNVIAHTQRDLLDHHCSFALNKKGKPSTLYMFCKQRGQALSKHILTYWTQFGLHLLTTFGHEIHSQSVYPSASYLGFQCVWTAYAKMAGPMCHALEKTKRFYEKLIRDNSRGGFMFSIEDALDQHDALDHNPSLQAQSIAEMDLVSAYGYSASKVQMPSGFCTGFKSFCTNDGTQLEKLDTRARHHSFEFRAVYKTILDMSQRTDIQIRAVYSNFSAYGLFCLGPYPIDLVITTSLGQVFLFQMDGAWCHGCPRCPSLERYVHYQTLEQVRKTTQTRDDHTLLWMNHINSNNKPSVSYWVIQDCCTLGYDPKSLQRAFETIPALAQVVKGYSITDHCGKSMTTSTLQQLLAKQTDSSYTFIAHADITIEPASYEQAPLIIYESRENKYAKQHLSYQGSVVLTRDYYQWLLDQFGSRVHVHHFNWILFYATEPCWNSIYNTLIQLRSSTQDPILVSFLKRIINLSCGFFGTRTTYKDKCSYRLVDAVPANYVFYLHYPDIYNSMDVGNNGYFLLETKSKPKLKKGLTPSNSALPMFLSVVEYGKLRLLQILQFIQNHVRPGYFKLLYSNVDNMLYTLANVDTLEEAVEPDRLFNFHQTKDAFLTVSKQPGSAEPKWIRNGDCGWKFVTLRTQHYSLVIAEQEHDDNLHKTAGWSGLSSWETYKASKSILEGEHISITQSRRINKIANVATHQVEFKY